jgi:hypothetical protein
VHTDPNFPLPASMRELIRRVNAEYLSLAQELSRCSALAAPLLGVNQEIVHIIEATRLTRFHPLVNSTMLVAQLRFQDPEVWRRFASGSMDANQLLHEFLRTIPAEFIAS